MNDCIDWDQKVRNRREEYADSTRRAILEAARQLFGEKGFFSTKVDEIAALARVCPATVYSVSGGKRGLLQSLMDMSTAAPIVSQTIERVTTIEEPALVIALLARKVRLICEEFGDILQLIIKTAPHDANAREALAEASARCRECFVLVARRLDDLHALRADIAVDEAVDVLWFYLSFSSFFTLTQQNKWSPDRAEVWLGKEASRYLLAGPDLADPRRETKAAERQTAMASRAGQSRSAKTEREV